MSPVKSQRPTPRKQAPPRRRLPVIPIVVGVIALLAIVAVVTSRGGNDNTDGGAGVSNRPVR